MTTQPHIDTRLNPAALEELQTALGKTFGDAIRHSVLAANEVTITVGTEDLIPTLTKLHADRKFQFTQLIDLCGVDWLGHRPAAERFDVVYHLLSMSKNLRLRVKVRVEEGGQVPTATGLFPNANWYERETWDMFGIPFAGHPDLRRILTDYDFSGHPLRKDFPLEGFVEAYYDADEKRVAYKPVDLPQEFRHFDKVSEWEGMTGNARLAETDNKISENKFNPEEFK